MDRIQRKRILIFMLIPILAVLLFITENMVIRIIVATLIVIYVAFIIFLRDSSKYSESFNNREETAPFAEDEKNPEIDESFQILSNHEKIEVITADSYRPESKLSKPTLKPPDLKERFEEIVNEELPEGIDHNGQFTFVIDKILSVLKEAYMAHTSLFFWYNRKNEKLSIEKFISNSTDVAQRKFDLEDDILSKIVQKGEPELLNDISPAAETDVIRYYNSPQGIKSFVGVPLFYDKRLIAIIVIDSKMSDAFGVETIYALGRFVRVITIIIAIFEEKHSDTISQQRLKGLLNLINPDFKFTSEQDIIAALEKSIKFLIPWDAYTFIYYHPLEKKFKTIKVINNTSLKYIGDNFDIDLNETLVGKSILTGMPVKIDDISKDEFIRFSKMENVSFEGSFIALPLVYDNQNYGVICFESLRKNIYTNSDVQFLMGPLNIISFILYSYSTQTLLKSYLAVDIETGALNEKTFKERLNAELFKAKQLKIPGALALIRIDDFIEQETLFDGNPFPKVLVSIAETIFSEMTPLNLFGRLSKRVFGIYFFNMSANQAFIWSEKLRVKIARKPIAVVSKQTTYTVSIGVASTFNKLDIDEIINNTNLVLKKVLEKGGNAVRNLN